MGPDVTVIENTAARVMTSHFEIASGGRGHPLGQVRRVEDVAPGGETAERAGPSSGLGAGVGGGHRGTSERRITCDRMSSTIRCAPGAARIIATACRRCDHAANGSSRRLRHPRRPRRRRARRADGRRLAADLPDRDLRPGRGRAAARRLRVRAEPEPDPRAARAGGRRPRERAPRDRVRVGVRGDGGHRPARRCRAGGRRRRRRVRRHVPLPRAGPRGVGRGGREVRGPRRGPGRRCGRSSPSATRLVWLETPSNPLLKVADIAQVAATILRAPRSRAGERPLLVVDNTFASPALQRPLEHGADIVFHSATKYLSGHSDTVLGVAVTSSDEVAARLRFLQNAMGAVPGPFDCFLVAARAADAGAPGRAAARRTRSAVARFLATRDDVAVVRYPGLAEGRTRTPARPWRAPDALGDVPAFGGMVSFRPGGRRAPRASGGGAGDRRRRGHAAVHPGRVAGRRGVADRGPGGDDPPVGRGVGAGRGSRRSSGSPSASRRSTTSSRTWPRRSTGPSPIRHAIATVPPPDGLFARLRNLVRCGATESQP